MMSLVLLPDELVEAVGKHVLHRHGLRAWCRVTSTCKRLWGMQLPGSADGWSVRSSDDIEGESKVSALSLAQCNLPCTYHRACVTLRRRSLGVTACKVNALIAG